MATLQHRLQRREIGVAVLAIGDDLAVDQAGRQVERGDVADERREFVGPVEAIAGVDAHVAARRGDLGAIAVIFDLVEPAVARRHGIDERRELERAEFGRLTLGRSEEHTSELQSLMRISYAVFCLKKKKKSTY